MSSENTLLVLHSDGCDPRPFIARLIQSNTPVEAGETIVPWRIDNKYYTADVRLRIAEVDGNVHGADGVPVILYLFEGSPPSPLPPALTKLLLSEPRDVALAVRTRSHAVGTGQQGTDDGEDPEPQLTTVSDEDLQEVFDELGMELVDETAIPEDDDERPITPLETVRQTLMTHMWPSMVRKGQSALAAVRHLSDDDHANYQMDPQHPDSPDLNPHSFPVHFSTGAQSSSDTAGSASFTVLDKADITFPDLSELRAQIGVSGDTSGEDFDFDRMDELREPGPEEYARLEEWLDEDDDELGTDFASPVPGSVGHDQLDDMVGPSRSPGSLRHGQEDTGQPVTDEKFEDDFDDFAAFQSAPSGQLRGQAEPGIGGVAGLDPTPLLLHLQAVRAELAGVQDADERRVRAGKEVLRVMKDLGMNGGLEEDDFDDLDDFDDHRIS